MDERAKDALTTPRLDAEQAGGMGQREPESWHFAEFRLDPRAQITFLGVRSARDARAGFGGLDRTLIDAEELRDLGLLAPPRPR